MNPNTLSDVPRTYLGLGKLIESLRSIRGWTLQPYSRHIELLIAAHYFQLESSEALQEFESNDYLNRALGRVTAAWTDFQRWIASSDYDAALSGLRALLLESKDTDLFQLVTSCDSERDATRLNGQPIEGSGSPYAPLFEVVRPSAFIPEGDHLFLDALIASQLLRLGRDCALPEFSIGKIPFFNDADLEKLETDGYFIKDGFASVQQTDQLRDIVYDLATSEAKDGKAYFYGNENRLQRVYNLLNKSPLFTHFFLARAEIFEFLQKFFGGNSRHTPYYLSSIQANILSPGAKAQILHVDSSVPDPLPPWKIRLNINLLLDPFTENNGATLVYPGSHKFLRKPKQSDNVESDLKRVVAPAGALVVWTGHLWHQSGANNSRDPRAALLACFVASYLREIAVEENYLEVMDRSHLEDLPFEVKGLLGYFHGRKVST